ncbi:MAG: SAM-dependent methyltransferase, partial [Candidatus Kerfeldbacteria bacterium]|nr:SAM-dependent methyltransferase [Candidatus Kerfeldbacteria bacterium]
MQPIFEKIYKDKVWYKGSGSGSLPENTTTYRDFLQKYIKQNNIKSILDLGCGDWQFMH